MVIEVEEIEDIIIESLLNEKEIAEIIKNPKYQTHLTLDKIEFILESVFHMMITKDDLEEAVTDLDKNYHRLLKEKSFPIFGDDE
jgi:hypothetical protein